MERLRGFLVATVLTSISAIAIGAEIKVEGVLKGVDAEKRTMTVERKTSAGTKEVGLEVAQEAGDLKHLKAGDEVAVTYDSTLEVVTKIISPSSVVLKPEIVTLKELGTAGHPWVTSDGLTIYYTFRESPQSSSAIWMATRADTDALFKDKKQVSLGLDCTFSEDGLEGVVFLPEQGEGTLQKIRRRAVTQDFGRPTLIKELSNKGLGEKDAFVMSPMLSSDGLTLYCELLSKGVCYCTRSSPSSPWSQPKKLPTVVSEDGNRRFPYVTNDGLMLFCTNTEVTDPKVPSIALYTRDKNTDPFVFTGYLHAGGTPLNGEFPRYIPDTKELFFVKKKDGRPEIHVVRNFDPMKAVAK